MSAETRTPVEIVADVLDAYTNEVLMPVDRDQAAEAIIAALTAAVLPHWVSRDPHRGGPFTRCLRCDTDLTRVGVTDLVYTYETCDCPAADYTHLVEQLWHRRCHAATAAREVSDALDRLNELLRHARRVALYQAHKALMKEAAKGERGAPRAQHITYTGGIRRAARIVDTMLGEVT